MLVLRVALVGAGKMGISHLSILRAHQMVNVVGICDQAGFLLDVLGKYTGLNTFTSYEEMLRSEHLDAVVIATPTPYHFDMAEAAIRAGVSVFCEKPLTLSYEQSLQLHLMATKAGVVTQVGYHNRFIGSFQEVKRLLDLEVLGQVSHALAESYGPVVLREKGKTWRAKRSAGGSCLYDYAAHSIDLLQWYFGAPRQVHGSNLSSIFSSDTDDEVYSNLNFTGGTSAHLSVNWSDESFRKMTTRISLWGRHGRIIADRQECRVYLNESAVLPEGYSKGWNVKYTTELTKPVWFYLRGEEYSAEIDHFIREVAGLKKDQQRQCFNDFESATEVDRTIEMILDDVSGDRSNHQIPDNRELTRQVAGNGSARGNMLMAPLRKLISTRGRR